MSRATSTASAASSVSALAVSVLGTAVLGGVVAAAGTVAARRVADRAVRAGALGGARRWHRSNHRDREVSLVAGPAVTVGVTTGVLLAPGLPPRVRAASALLSTGVGAVGLLDDLAGDAGSKGLRGHLGALRSGRLTTGVVKIGGIGACGLLAAAAVTPSATPGGRHVASVLVGGAAVAAHANLLNLFDLRPGRALKVTLLHAPLLLPLGTRSGSGAAVPVGSALGAALAALPADLDEQTMLGDAGANVLGALLGLGLVAGSGPRARVLHLGALVALTLLSERVSFSRVIDANPLLARVDGWGRHPAPDR